MRVLVVGLGTQGRKRIKLLGSNFIGSVDPSVKDADYKDIFEVPLTSYDAAFLCVPDDKKIDLVNYCIQVGKHVLVEKPFLAESAEVLKQIQDRANKVGIYLYTAYNHRFEPHIKAMRKIFAAKELGKIYSIKLLYGNGTSQLVRSAGWRDQGMGVIVDIAPHLFDMLDFWIGKQKISNLQVRVFRFETSAPDYSTITANYGGIALTLEMSWCHWKNTFTCDVIGEKGSAHISSFCKWGPSILTKRQRVLPSGIPKEDSKSIKGEDPTWIMEHKFFFSEINDQSRTNLSKDIWIAGLLRDVALMI